MTAPRPGRYRILELGGILGAWSLVGSLATRIVRFADETSEWIAVGVGSVLGYLLADFMSGLLHWLGDTLGDDRTPVLGRAFIVPFREHHVDPMSITRHDFVQTNGNTSLATLPFLGVVFLGFPEPEAPGLFVTGLIASGGLWSFCTNQFHKWAHADSAPRLVRALQRAGLILSPERHARHHAPPHDGNFCITAGWLSRPLDRIGFFRGLERFVAAVRPSLLHRERRA